MIAFLPLFVLIFIGVPAFGGALWVKKRREAKDATGPDESPKKTKGSNSDGASDRTSREETRRLPYRYADDRLFVFDNSVWTGVRLLPITDEQLSEAELRDQVVAANIAVQELATGDKPVPAMVRVTHRPITTGQWAEKKIVAAWDPTEMYNKITYRHAALLEAQQTTRPEVYILVKIATVTPRGEAAINRALDEQISGVHAESIGRDQIKVWHRDVDNLLARLNTLACSPMTRDDLLWLIRKPMHGHLMPGVVDYLPSRPWGDGQFQLVANLQGENKSKTHLVLRQTVDDPYAPPEMQGTTQTSYTTFLVAASWPSREKFNLDRAWIRWMAQRPEQIEVCVRTNLIPPREFRDDAKDMRDDLKEEIADMRKSGREPDSNMLEQRQRTEELVVDLDNRPFPGLQSQIILQLSADSLEEMEQLQRDVRQMIKTDLDRQFVRPPRYQWRALQAMLPGDAPSGLTVVAPFVRLHESEVIAIGLPNTGSEVGDNPQPGRDGELLGFVGDYIGTTRDGVPTHFSTHVGPERQSGGGVGTVGASGGGKSTLALLKFFMESESGVRTVAIDPKVDFGKFVLYISFGPQVNEPGFDDELDRGILGKPEEGSKFTPVNPRFWADSQIIDIARSEDGILEIFQLARTVSEGFLLAQTVFEMFLGRADYGLCRHPLSVAINNAKRTHDEAVAEARRTNQDPAGVPRPSMWAIVNDVIRQADHAKSHDANYETTKNLETAAAILETLRGAPYARLVFAENPRNIGALDRRRTIFTTRGMNLPKDPNPDNWNGEHRLTTTIMYLVTRMASQMLEVAQEPNPVTGKPGLRPKLMFVDEAYAISALPAGRQMLLTSLAQGRSYFFVVWMIDQQAARFAQIEEEGAVEASGNQFHTIFAYLQKTKREARNVLPLLGREDNARTADALRHENEPGGNMRTGVNMMRDVDSRVATVEVDLVFTEFLAATDTNPKTRPIRQSAPISPDPDDWSFMRGSDVYVAITEAEKDLHVNELTDEDRAHMDAELSAANDAPTSETPAAATITGEMADDTAVDSGLTSTGRKQ